MHNFPSNATAAIIKTPTKQILCPQNSTSSPSLSTSFSTRTPSTSILKAVQMNNLLLEFSSLRVDCPPGCYLMPQLNDFFCWHGILFIHCDEPSPFVGIVLRFSVHFPSPEESCQLLSIGSVSGSSEESRKFREIPKIKFHFPSNSSWHFVHPLLKKNGNEFDLAALLEAEAHEREKLNERERERERNENETKNLIENETEKLNETVRKTEKLNENHSHSHSKHSQSNHSQSNASLSFFQQSQRIPIGKLMALLLDSLRNSGLQRIIHAFKDEFESGNSQNSIPNVEAFKMLLHDSAGFEKLAASLPKEEIEFCVENCPFHFEREENASKEESTL